MYDDYLGDGYGIVSDHERQAIHTFASLEGILLDPVYTGRAAGGTPAIFAYEESLL